MKVKRIFFFFLSVLFYHSMDAQLFSTEGKEFFLSFMNNNDAKINFVLPDLTLGYKAG